MKPKVAVLCGGISPERDVSIVSGQNVFDALKDSFDAQLIRLDENKLPENLNPQDTIIYPAMHGDYGEDGTLQAELDEAGFSYAGCDSLASRACMIKPATKSLLKFASLPVPRSLEFNAKNKPSAQTLFELFPNGSIIKPADKGSSVGLIVARTIQDAEGGLSQIEDGEWMAEEFCKGREFSIGVIYGKACGVVEIMPEGGVYDFKRKYTAGSTKYEFPAKISKQAEDAMRTSAEKAFKVCGCRDFSRVDFIMTDEENLKFVILEINTLPGMTPTSLLPKSASCVGYDFKSLCEKLLEGAIARHSK